MGHTDGLDDIFDRRRTVKGDPEGGFVLFRWQEIVQLLVEPEFGKTLPW
jgi:hypothetical protein